MFEDRLCDVAAGTDMQTFSLGQFYRRFTTTDKGVHLQFVLICCKSKLAESYRFV